MNLSTAISFLPVQPLDGQRAAPPLPMHGTTLVSLAQTPAASVTPSSSGGNTSSNNSSSGGGGQNNNANSRDAAVNEARFKVQAIAGLAAVDEVVSSDGSIDFVKLNYIVNHDHQIADPAQTTQLPGQATTGTAPTHLDLQA